jgi:hypothetical protein
MDTLPNEILCMIQNYLPLKDIIACQLASKVFHSYSEFEILRMEIHYCTRHRIKNK